MNKIESGIISVLKQGVPLRAKESGNVPGVTPREVNHCLYTSLQTRGVRDQKCRWMLKSALHQEEQLSLPFEMAQQQSSLDGLLKQQQQQVRETALEQTLKSPIDFSEE